MGDRAGAGDSSDAALGADLRDVRPAAGAAELAASRARIEQALFGKAEPARLGRFVLVGPIAGGGMGVVHGAYDPELDRRVALKLVHPRERGDARARELLVEEARALARLDHPNVVPVHDVLVESGEVVIVMELVAGQTLTAWEAAAPRSWREIVAVYVQAGRGLAAAHTAGIVHRDFKPTNAIVGDDGRVRVLDFGLARLEDGEAMPGEVVGTAAYGAPEQLAGEAATAASDQFSFCVALHRALHGVLPFGARAPAGRRAEIAAGRIARGTRDLPAWLSRIVDRGLAADPARRHASMAALLALLEQERGWRRWRAPSAAAAIAGLGGLALALALRGGDDPLAACDGGAPALAKTLRRAEIDEALRRAGTSYAESIRPRVLGGLDDYGAAWSRTHREACVAHRRGEQSDAMLDRGMLCLQRRLADLDAAVKVLAGTRPLTVANALDVVAGLPAVAACADLEALTAEIPPPPSALAPAVAAVRARLSHAAALDRGGRSGEAIAAASAASAEAAPLGYAPVAVEAALEEGRIRLFRREHDRAISALRVAEETGLRTGQLAAAIEASARRIYAEGVLGRDLPALVRQLEVLEPLSRSLRGDRFVRPLLLNTIGVVQMSRGDREAARRYFEAAHAALAGVERPALELTSIPKNVAMLTGDPSAREALIVEAWRRRDAELGPAHLATLEAVMARVHYTADPVRSLPLLEEACALYHHHHPDLTGLRASCDHYRAFLHAELGDEAAAAAIHADVASRGVPAGAGTGAAAWQRLSEGYAHLYRGAPALAQARFTSVAETIAGAGKDTWWSHAGIAHARLGAGLALRAAGRDRDAIAELEQAAEAFERLTTINEDVEPQQRLALSRSALAAALRATRGPAEQIRRLEEQAAAFYRAASPSDYRRGPGNVR
jgi:eukaryotic-like serine/threonine-protein kinase